MSENATITTAQERPGATQPWDILERLIEEGAPYRLIAFLRLLPSDEVAYTIEHLSDEDQRDLFELLAQLKPELAASLMEYFVDEKVADLLLELEPARAAAIVDLLPSDDQADILSILNDKAAHAILERMDPQEADDARERLHHDPDTAGGLMITEFLSYRSDQDVDDVIHDLRIKADEINSTDYEMRYVYLTDEAGVLEGVVTMRTLMVSRTGRKLRDLAVHNPLFVLVDTPLQRLETLFDSVRFSVVPVVDEHDVLLGVVQRTLIQEALSERESQTFMKFGGIIGGEEIRSMPLMSRTMRRMAFLLPNILLSYVAVSIIAMYEPVIENLTALAIFLPMVANLSGAAGNQAVAVSIRELALGLVTQDDMKRIWKKEIYLGAMNGLIIGLLLAMLSYVMRGDLTVSTAVGGAYFASCVFAVISGGALPLLLKKIGVDPAMMSSPILTTVTDMFSFFFVLTFAALIIAQYH